MPGAYAHITLASETLHPDAFDGMGLDGKIIGGLLQNKGYFQLGAVSPDMPYLVGTGRNESAIAWADRMHREDIAPRIKAGIEAVKSLSANEKKIKCLAWLLGFVEHVVYDVFLHPIVNEIAHGEYGPDTKSEHQRCEMNQDVYILKTKFNITDPSDGRLFGGVLQYLHGEKGISVMDDDIHGVFDFMLRQGSSDLYGKYEPKINDWFSSFVAKMKFQEKHDVLVGIGRHVGVDLVYPKFGSIDEKYIVNLSVPGGSTKHYDELFEQGKGHVLKNWRRILDSVILNKEFDSSMLDGWNLDSGRDASNDLHFWS